MYTGRVGTTSFGTDPSLGCSPVGLQCFFIIVPSLLDLSAVLYCCVINAIMFATTKDL